MKKAEQAVSPLMTELSKYMAGATRKAPPREAVDRARIHLVASDAVAATDAFPALRAPCRHVEPAFAAAAAAGALLKLDARQMRYMLSYMGQQAASMYTMFRDPEHIAKAYAMAWCTTSAGRSS